MNSVERVKKICKERKIAISKLEKDLGYANGYIGQLRKGVFPSDRLKNIADYLGVSTEYLIGGKGAETSELNAKDEKDIAKDIDTLMQKLKSGEDGPANYGGEAIPEDDLELFAGQLELMLKRLKAINKEKYNPHKNKK